MKQRDTCPKCGGKEIARVPDNGRYANGNNIYTTRLTLLGRIPVIRYVCCACGFVEQWVEDAASLEKVRKNFGSNENSRR